MNYQIAPFWFYSGKIILMVFTAIGLSFFGITALIFYGLLIGLVFNIAIPMRLHQLVEKGFVVIPEKLSQWTIYVHGIPVQETRSQLTNPHFAVEEHMRTFFLRSFITKIIAQITVLTVLISQVWKAAPTNVWILSIALTAGFWIAVKCISTFIALNAIFRQTWQHMEVVTRNDSVWYCAGFGQGSKQVTALDKLLLL
ncbi:hypothetical protein [Budvicia diplopodorum]|uniref:hypothetical protein n=1 Tax=Budvicia diplopodorum TaxID=1119056 RepID=UPI0013569EF3|nr:hypothetical protein [Budvicia diplopodorum]